MDYSKTYKLRMIARPDDLGGPEEEYEVIIQAHSQLAARRLILERVWGCEYLVSRFCSVERIANS